MLVWDLRSSNLTSFWFLSNVGKNMLFSHWCLHILAFPFHLDYMGLGII